MEDVDEFGPEKIIELYDPKTSLRAVVVIDNTALGPGKGGIRMTPTVDVHEVKRLARGMTWKTAIHGLPFGGAKSGIIAEPHSMSPEKKASLVRAFARAIKPISPEIYVAAPDMNTTEAEMRILAEENGRKSVTGKPADIGGIPHELGTTAWGVAHSARIAAKHVDLDINGATIAIEGFGNVGLFTAKFLSESGARIVAVSDSKGVAYMPKGFDFALLEKIKQEQGTVTKYPGAKLLHHDKLVALDVDMLIPAAIPDFITLPDVKHIKTKLIVEGSNIPMSPSIERILWKKGVTIVPDFVANGGGVIGSWIEYENGGAKKAFKEIEARVVKNTKTVLVNAEKERITTRDAAMDLAKERVLKAR